MPEGNENLLQKLSKIRNMCDVAQKSKKGFNYTYVDVSEILANVTAGMKKYGVSLIPSIAHGTESISNNKIESTKFDKSGRQYTQVTSEYLFTGEMFFKWVDDESGEELSVPWFATGSMSDPSQSFGAALSYTRRQFLLSFFSIAQVDSDVDAYRSKQKAAEESEKKAIAESIVQEIDTAVKLYLASNPDKSDDVKKFISGYVKSANYLSIKTPELASKLLEDFKNTYKMEE